jgi:hypothetical protein
MDFAQDPLIDNMSRFIKNRKPFKLPVFWIATIGKRRIDQVIPMLKSFDNLRVTQRSSLDCRYQIGLVPVSSSYKNGAVIPFGYPVKELPTEVPAAELPDKPIQPSGNSEKGQQVETSIQPQEISRVFLGSQIGHPPSDPQDYYVSDKSPVPSKHWQRKVGNEEKSDRHFNVSFVGSRSNSSLSENWKMNSGCATAAPMKMVSSHHPPTENKGGFSSSEVKTELRGNGTNFFDSSLTRSEVFPKLVCSKEDGDQKSYVSSVSQQSTTSSPKKRYPVFDSKMGSSHQISASVPVEESESRNATNIRRKRKTFFDLLCQWFPCFLNS